jgi:hypothetical protein
MNLSFDLIMQMGVNLITLGAFYGIVKTELFWIKKSLDIVQEDLKEIRNKKC